MIFNYILDAEHNPVPCEDYEQWGQWFMDFANRCVARDEIAPGLRVSTVFLGLDHNFFGEGPPVLFETMVLDDYEAGEMVRYCTWAEAEAGHRAVCEQLRLRIAAYVVGDRT